MKRWCLRNTWSIEILFGMFIVAGLVLRLNRILIHGSHTLLNDHLWWGYSVYSFFAEGILNGEIPFWNPYSQGGEPFLANAIQLRFHDPLLLLTLGIGGLFSKNTYLLYNWSHFAGVLGMCTGTYLCFRKETQSQVVRLILLFVIFHSSLVIGSLRQPGPIYNFLWAPWVYFLLDEIVRQKRSGWGRWVGLGALIGVNWQSYYFAPTMTMIFFYFVSTLLFSKDLLWTLFHRQNWARMGTASLIILLMMGPNFCLLKDRGEFIYPARIVDQAFLEKGISYGPKQTMGRELPSSENLLMSYDVIRSTGTRSTLFDFLQIIDPTGNPHIFRDTHHWGRPSEAVIYFGMLPAFIMLLGVFLKKNLHGKMMLFQGLLFALLCLGPEGGVHRILYTTFPPLWFLRHTHSLVPFFLFFALYFFTVGLDRVWSRGKVFELPSEYRPSVIRTIIFLLVMAVSTCFLFAQIWIQWFDLSFVWIVLGFTIVFIYFRNWIHPKVLFWGTTAFLFILALFSVSTEGPALGLLTGKTSDFEMLSINLERALPFVRRCLSWIAIPVILWWLSHQTFASPLQRMSRRAAILVSLAAIVFDINQTFFLARHLWGLQPAPSRNSKLQTQALDRDVPTFRDGSPAPISSAWGSTQSIRYLEILRREPFALTSVLPVNPETFDSLSDFRFEDALVRERWSSFQTLRNYYTLMNSALDPRVIAKLLTAGSSTLKVYGSWVYRSDSEAYSQLQAQTPSEATAFLEQSVLLHGQPPIESVKQQATLSQMSILRSKPNELIVSVQTSTPALFVWSDGFDPRWKVEVNNRASKLLRANFNSKAVEIPKGDSVVRFTYEYPHLSLALFVFYVVFLFGILVCWISTCGSPFLILRPLKRE